MVFRWFFARIYAWCRTGNNKPAPRLPMFVLVVVALTLGGLRRRRVVGSPWRGRRWLAPRGVGTLRSLRRGHTGALPPRIARDRRVSFLVFGPALVSWYAVMCSTAWPQDVHRAADRVRLPTLLGIAALACAASVVSNLPRLWC